MKKEKKLMALFMSMTLGLAATVTNYTYAAPATIQATEDGNSHNESVTNEAVSIEAVGLKSTYATGETISIDVRVINKSNKNLKIVSPTSSFGKAATIGATLKSHDGKAVKDNYYDMFFDTAIYEGYLNENEYVQLGYIYDTKDVTPGAFTLYVSFTYEDEYNKKQNISRAYPVQIGVSGGTEYETEEITGGAAFLSDKAAEIKEYTDELSVKQLSLPIKLYEYPGAKYYTMAINENYGYSMLVSGAFVPSKVYTDENGKVWGYVESDNFINGAAWYCISDLKKYERYLSVYYGDFDYDGKVTLKDAKIALRLALGIDRTTEEQMLFGDIDGDGIKLTDAKEYLRMSLGIIPAKEKKLSIDISGETRKFTGENASIEAVKVDEKSIFKYIDVDEKEIELSQGNEGFPKSFLQKINTDAGNQFGTKIAMMQLFDMSEEEYDEYEYFKGYYRYWCDKFGYDNLSISLEETATSATIGVDNSTSYFQDEIGGEGVISTVLSGYAMIFRVPKSKLEGKKLYKEYSRKYAVGYDNPENIEWTFTKVPDVNEVTLSACMLTTESAVDEELAAKCDFDNYDYIQLTVPFNFEDSYDRFYELSWTEETMKTVGEMYHSGEISRPDNFDAATYMNDRVFVNENDKEKVLSIKTNFTLYDQLYYEDIANYGTALIKVEKNKYKDYKIMFEIFGRDLSLSTSD